jgi:hypothetical protein
MVKHDRRDDLATMGMGDLHLGCAEEDVRHWARAAGLHVEQIRPLRTIPAAKGPALFAAVLRAC